MIILKNVLSTKLDNVYEWFFIDYKVLIKALFL